jgi:HTH-type transcriptional regulator/antitoxin HigA
MELVRLFPLRPIRSHAELDRANEVAGQLAERGEENLSTDEADYLDVLGDLIEKYEDTHLPMPEHTAPAVELRAYMDARGLSQAEVARAAAVSSSTVSEFLSGKRPLGKRPASRLAAFFGVPIGVFLE